MNTRLRFADASFVQASNEGCLGVYSVNLVKMGERNLASRIGLSVCEVASSC